MTQILQILEMDLPFLSLLFFLIHNKKDYIGAGFRQRNLANMTIPFVPRLDTLIRGVDSFLGQSTRESSNRIRGERIFRE